MNPPLTPATSLVPSDDDATDHHFRVPEVTLTAHVAPASLEVCTYEEGIPATSSVPAATSLFPSDDDAIPVQP
jgi:hypothetical protein